MSWFWKHKEKKVIIKQECFDKLHPVVQQKFEKIRQVNRIPSIHTHMVNVQADTGGFYLSPVDVVDDGFLLSAIVGEMLADEIREDDYVDDTPIIEQEDTIDNSDTTDDN